MRGRVMDQVRIATENETAVFSVPPSADGYISAFPLEGCEGKVKDLGLDRMSVEMISLLGHPSAEQTSHCKSFKVKALFHNWNVVILAEKLENQFHYRLFWSKLKDKFHWGFLLCFLVLVGSIGLCISLYNKNIQLHSDNVGLNKVNAQFLSDTVTYKDLIKKLESKSSDDRIAVPKGDWENLKNCFDSMNLRFNKIK